VDIKKCEFGVTETTFLGFVVSKDGIRVDPEKVAAVARWKAPQTIREIQSFLGFCNFYRRFIKNYSRMSYPLACLTRKNWKWDFNTECQESFQNLKNALISAPVLQLYDPYAETRVETDSSDFVSAGALTQRGKDNEWHPVAYYSKILEDRESNYPIQDKEILAIINALKQWRGELTGLQSKFLVITDHRALEYFTTKKQLNSRQSAWLDLIACFDFDITYRPGKENVIADVLSRKGDELRTQKEIRTAAREQVLIDPSRVIDPTIATVSVIEFPTDLDLVDEVLQANRASDSLADWREVAGQPNSPFTLHNTDLLLHKGRLVIPEDGTLRTRLITEVHTSTLLQGRYSAGCGAVVLPVYLAYL
jgi:hypothetical protein